MRKSAHIAAAVAITLGVSLFAVAEPTPAPATTTAPLSEESASTQPSATAVAALPAGVDPLVTWAAYDKAMRAGDVDYLFANYKCANANEARYARAMAQVDAGNGMLMQAVEDKFGAKAGHEVGHKLGDVCADDAKTGTVALRNSTTAIITTDEPESSFSFVLVDGVWKHDVAQMTREAGFDLTQVIENSAKSAEAVKVIRQDLLAGKYATVEAVMTAVEESRK